MTNGTRDLPPLRVGELTSRAVARLRALGPRLWPVLGAWSVATAVPPFFLRAAGGAEALGPGSPTFLVYVAGVSVLNAVFIAGVVRMLLGRGAGAWRPDAGMAAYLAFSAASGLASGLLLASVPPPPANPADEAAVAAYGGSALAFLLAAPVLVWAALRLLLWPIGLLMGERALTLSRAWALMRRAVAGYLGAVVVLAGAPTLLAVWLGGVFNAGGGVFWLVAGMASAAFGGLLSAAVAAEIYRARVTGDGVAGVFE